MIFRTSIKILLAVLILFTSCNNPDAEKTDISKAAAAKTDMQPEIEFESTSYDFGRIEQGEQVGWYFRFKNTGGSDLVITNATASCGCTIPDYSKKPVPPGGEGMIKVVFDSKGRSGKQFKTVTIESNAKTLVTKLNLEAEIIKKN